MERCQTDSAHLLSSHSDVYSLLRPAISFAFITSDKNIVPASAITDPTRPANLTISKIHYNEQLEEMQQELKEVQTRGTAAAEEWSKGLESRGKARTNSSERWERWHIKYQCWLQHQDSRRTTASISASPTPSAPPQTGSPTDHLGNHIFGGLPVTSTSNQPLPPRPVAAPQPAYLSQHPPQAPFYHPRPERSIHDANEAKAARKADIERRCQALNPPIPPNVLRHMESFKAAIQIPQPMTETHWRVLQPRLLLQRASAEQIENERTAHQASLQTRVADRRQQDASLKEVKEVLDREWEDAQKPVRDRLSSFAEDFIHKYWADGKTIDYDNSPRFAAELLLFVRQRFYADIAKEDEISVIEDQEADGEPQNRHSKRTLILDSMKWVYDNKVKPLTESFRKDLFLCNGSGCQGNSRFYGFEGVIQHYGAKHTNLFSVGNVVVHWKEAEWPEEPPFCPEPNGARSTMNSIPTSMPPHGHAGHSAYNPYPYGGYSRGGTATPQMPLHLPRASSGPYNPQYGNHFNGPFAPPPPPPNAMQGINYDYSQPYGQPQPMDNYNTYQSMPPSMYVPAGINSGYSTSPAMFSAMHAPMQGQMPGFPVPNGIGMQTSPRQGVPATAVVEPDPPPSRTEYLTNLFEEQVSELVEMAREIWTSTSGIKDLPNSVRVYVMMHRVIQKFYVKFNNEPILEHFVDALNKHSSLRALKSTAGLFCRACHPENLHQSSFPSSPHSRVERKTFNVLSLFSHFKSVHDRPAPGKDYQNGHQIPSLDWKEDMIELPSDRTISGLIYASGMDDDKLNMIARVFPKLFPTHLPRVGLVESTSVAPASRTGSKEPKESDSARQTPGISSERPGLRPIESPNGLSPQTGPRAGEEEYDPLRPSLVKESRYPRSSNRRSAHPWSLPPEERRPVYYAEPRYYLPRDAMDDEYIGPSRRGYVELSPTGSRMPRESGPMYEEVRQRRPIFVDQEEYSVPSRNELFVPGRPELDPQDHGPYIREVRYREHEGRPSEYRLSRSAYRQQGSQSPSKAMLDAEHFLDNFIPGENYEPKATERDAQHDDERRPQRPAEPDMEDGSRYTPPPPNVPVSADDHLDSKPVPGNIQLTPGPHMANGSRYEDPRANGRQVPTPESAGASRRVGATRRRDYYRYMSVARDEPYARGQSITRTHSRYGRERKYERYEEERRRLDQETPQPNAEPEPEGPYSRDRSVDQAYPDDPYYHQIRHSSQEYIPVNDRASYPPVRYRYDGAPSDVPPPTFINEYGEPIQYVRVQRAPRVIRASYPTQYVSGRPHPGEPDHPVEYAPASHNRGPVRPYVYHEGRPARQPYEAEGELERVQFEDVGPEASTPAGLAPPPQGVERRFLNPSR